MARDSNAAEVLADLLFPQEEDFAENILDIPPVQRKLHTETYDFTVQMIVNKLADGSIFIPTFQRNYVWSDIQASKLIESLIIQCPIPVIYLNQEKDENYSVIDGNQRTTSFARFLNDEFSLKGLTAYTELEGYKFSQLDPRFQRHIKNRTIRCISILKETHPQVKFDVFERLNSGATQLTRQEIRHGLYYGKLMELASEIVESRSADIFTYVQAIHPENKRMKAEEFILRFWSFTENFDVYTKPLAGFINTYVQKNRKPTKKKLAELRSSFINTLQAVIEVFGKHSFQTFTIDDNGEVIVQSKFNAALYDAKMIGFYQLLKEERLDYNLKGERALILMDNLFKDVNFKKSISQSTSDVNPIRSRVSTIKENFSLKK
ncbi:TPA: DUF262 domain-containing protein [Acinetobacter baumannii]|nr:DUF262 domain-containing protein [Acinetobacter baumannii]